LGISVDHVPCLKSWADSLGGIHYPLLSDFWPHGSVAERYGVLRTADGFSERAIFVIDKKGYIRYIDIHNIEDKPDNEEVRKALQQIEAAEKAATEATAPRSYAFSDLQEDEIPKGDIVLYCAKWCKDCRKAKTWLDERGLAYVEVDIDYNMAARNQVRRWANGFLVTPVIDIAGTIVLDFDIPKLEEALREKGR
jgi:arsenate reductase-like glutaredoxin family protein